MRKLIFTHLGENIKTFSAYKIPEFLGSLNPHWTLLKNNVKKQHLLSELLTKVQLRENLFLFPALYNQKLLLQNQSRECQDVQQ